MAAIKVLSGSLPVSRPGWTAARHPLPTTAHRHGCSDVSRCRQTVPPWGEGRAPPWLPAACGRVLRHCREPCGPQCHDVLVKQPAAQKRCLVHRRIAALSYEHPEIPRRQGTHAGGATVASVALAADAPGCQGLPNPTAPANRLLKSLLLLRRRRILPR